MNDTQQKHWRSSIAVMQTPPSGFGSSANTAIGTAMS